jgi:hypothetical protein
VLRALTRQPRTLHAVSACRSVGALHAAAAAFPLSSPGEGALQGALDDLRARFRAAAAQLGVSQAYAPGRGGAPGAFAAPGLTYGAHMPPEGAPLERDLSF